MSWIFFEGKIIQESQANLKLNNRAFRFADGCFESIKVVDGKAVFWQNHLQRLTDTTHFLQMEIPLSELALRSISHELIQKNEISKGAILRIMLYRKGDGKYLPETNEGDLFIAVIPTHENGFLIPVLNKKLGLEKDLLFSSSQLGNHKLLNKTGNVIAALNARNKGFDDFVLFNERSEIIESISSNIFLLKGDFLYTPSLESGCLNGTIRQVLISNSKEFDFKIRQSILFENDLKEADEIWTTNAFSGISAVISFEGITFSSSRADRAQEKLLELAINSTKDR